MFCLSCQNLKAETGCYLPNSFSRVCLACYQSTIGSMPLPSGSASALGGTFADAGKLKKFSQAPAADQMNTVSSDVIAEASGNLSAKLGEVREAKEAFWKQMPDEVQEYRNRFNEKRREVRDEVIGKAEEIKDKIMDEASKFNPFDMIF